jgi:tetratricopeptide (TPR) repeat protein
MGNPSRALKAYLQSLAGAEGTQAAHRLRVVVSKGMASETELLEMLATHPRAQNSAEGMRLLCEWRLKVRPDRQAVQSCQAFGQAHPAHPAVHRLALAAGLVAENHLQDWNLAVEEYSRALVVSEFAELPSSDALFFRARARARLGQVQEARADLRLFLHVDSSSWNRKEVDDLMRKLNISRE